MEGERSVSGLPVPVGSEGESSSDGGQTATVARTGGGSSHRRTPPGGKKGREAITVAPSLGWTLNVQRFWAHSFSPPPQTVSVPCRFGQSPVGGSDDRRTFLEACWLGLPPRVRTSTGVCSNAAGGPGERFGGRWPASALCNPSQGSTSETPTLQLGVRHLARWPPHSGQVRKRLWHDRVTLRLRFAVALVSFLSFSLFLLFPLSLLSSPCFSPAERSRSLRTRSHRTWYLAKLVPPRVWYPSRVTPDLVPGKVGTCPGSPPTWYHLVPPRLGTWYLARVTPDVVPPLGLGTYPGSPLRCLPLWRPMYWSGRRDVLG